MDPINQTNSFGNSKKKDFKNDFRARLNVKNYSLLLEHNNFRKKTAIKLSNNITKLSSTIQIINNLTIWDMLKIKGFSSKIRFFNSIAIKGFLVYEVYYLGKIVFHNLNINNNYLNIDSKSICNGFDSNKNFHKASDSIFKLLTIFYLGRLVNFYTPKVLTSFIFADFIFKYFSFADKNNIRTEENKNDNNLSYKNLISIINIKLKNLLSYNVVTNLPFTNIRIIDYEEFTLQKMLVVYSLVKMLHLNFNDNKKFYKASNTISIQYINTKHLKMFFSLYFLGKLSNWFGLMGVSTLDLHSTEGIVITAASLLAINKFYLIGFVPIFLFNPYSLFIYSSVKNHLNEEYMKNSYYSKNRLERIKIMALFFGINMFFYSKKIYF